jgi:hypothetical protein
MKAVWCPKLRYVTVAYCSFEHDAVLFAVKFGLQGHEVGVRNNMTYSNEGIRE